MSLFRIDGGKLSKLNEKPVDLERDIQKITEDNLNEVFGLTFLQSEFQVQNFRLDTVAFDTNTKSFVIIEYKRDESSSVVDQSFSYLSILHNYREAFILLYQKKLNKIINDEDIDWSQSRIIIIAQSFTKHQENAINFKDLPVELYEVKLYSNNLVSYNQIKSALKRTASLTTIKQTSSKEKEVLKEVKEYTLEHHFKEWHESRQLYDKLKEQLPAVSNNITEKITKFYLSFFKEDTNKSFFEIVVQKQGLKVYLRPHINELKNPTPLKLEDCSVKGHWTNGNTVFMIEKLEDMPYALSLLIQTYELVYR